MKLNGEAFEREDIRAVAGKIVRLDLNADGEIREITTYDVPAVLDKYDFNGEILSFGGEGLQRGYATDKNTMFICIPKFYDEEEDYYVRVQLETNPQPMRFTASAHTTGYTVPPCPMRKSSAGRRQSRWMCF